MAPFGFVQVAKIESAHGAFHIDKIFLCLSIRHNLGFERCSLGDTNGQTQMELEL